MSGFERHPPSESYAQPLEPLDENSMELAYDYTRSFKQLHPGFDCLVIKRDRLPAFITYLGDVYIAFPPVGRMLTRAAKYADNECTTITNMHTTFHLGTRNGDWDSDNDTLAYQTLNGNIIQERYEYLEKVNGGKLLGNGVRSRRNPPPRKNPRTAKAKKNQAKNQPQAKEQPEQLFKSSKPVSSIQFSSSGHSDRKSISKTIEHALRMQKEKSKVRHRSHPKGHRQLTEIEFDNGDIGEETELEHPLGRRRLGSVKPKCITRAYIPSSGIKGKFGRQCKYDSKYAPPSNSHMFFQDWREKHKQRAPAPEKKEKKRKKKKNTKNVNKNINKKAMDKTVEQIRSSKLTPEHSQSRHERRKKAKYQVERIKQQYTE